MYMRLCDTVREHRLHAGSTLLSNMFFCCAVVLAYITQKPAVCYVPMSLPVQQFVLHIPRHHHIVRGMMLIGLNVWKSPLYHPWGSLPQMYTHTPIPIHILVLEETASADTRPHEILVVGVMFSMSGSPEVPHRQHCNHHKATVQNFWLFLVYFCPLTTNFSPVAETTHWTVSCECPRKREVLSLLHALKLFLFSYFPFSRMCCPHPP